MEQVYGICEFRILLNTERYHQILTKHILEWRGHTSAALAKDQLDYIPVGQSILSSQDSVYQGVKGSTDNRETDAPE